MMESSIEPVTPTTRRIRFSWSSSVKLNDLEDTCKNDCTSLLLNCLQFPLHTEFIIEQGTRPRRVRISWSSVKLNDLDTCRNNRTRPWLKFPQFALPDVIKDHVCKAKRLWSDLAHSTPKSYPHAHWKPNALFASSSLELQSSANGGEDKEDSKKQDFYYSPYAVSSSAATFSSQETAGGPTQQKSGSAGGGGTRPAKQVERVLISEVLVENKDGEELDNPELLNVALSSLKSCKPNSALTVQEVQEDVRRVIESGYFASCKPVAVDTRDGIRLVFQVEPNQEFRGLICEGANVLPTRIVEDAFRGEYGKVVNIQRLDKVLNSINNWYADRGLFAQISDVDMLSGGIIKLIVSEAEVNNITIRFLDRKTGEPTVGKTRPETLLRQLTTKKGQVYSLQQGRRDVETLLTMGIMEDVSIVPQSTGDPRKVDLTLNVVERVSGGFSAGGGISGSGMSGGGLLSGLIGSFAYSNRNVFGRNQKLNISVERGQLDSSFRVNYTDPWIEGDDKRTSRSMTFQNSRTPGNLIYGPSQSSGPGDPTSMNPPYVTIGRLMASIDYSRPLRPRWSGTAGVSFQRAGPLERDPEGQIRISDMYGAPLTFSGKEIDDMLIAKLETVYADSNDRGSSMLVFNMEQSIPVLTDWLAFNRVNVRARHGRRIGPAYSIASFSGGKLIGDLAPHEAFAIGGTNSVRGYEEGAVGSGRSSLVASGEISVPLFGPLEGVIFADYGTDMGSGQTVPGDPAGARNKPGSGYGYGVGVRVDSPLGPLRLEYAQNNQATRRFHFGVGYRN